ncbi:MAG: RluA family pseudouridine synthase [Thermoleophilaceae bacterium]
MRLDAVLAARPEVSSRAAAQRAIQDGLVEIEGVARTKAYRLTEGERVIIKSRAAPGVEDAPQGPDTPLGIVFEDAHMIVVDKPAGLVVHPAPGHPSGTLVQALAGRAAGGAEAWRPGLVHRLDRDTSGLMVVAKSERVHGALQRLIRERTLRREYIALVDGHPESRSGLIDAPIGRDRRERTAHSTSTDRPRSARTHFEIERSYARATLLRVRLETGRTHQIRVHLAAIGNPVCGDELYGGGPCGARLGLRRQFLHSCLLIFQHPVSGVEVRCESALPDDLARADRAAAREPDRG